jgi:xylulokinase
MSHTRSHLYRAILEAYGYGIRHGIEESPAKGPIRRVVATGGGARSDLWRQIVSDITGLTQEYVSRADAPLGDAFLAAYAVGAITDFNTIKTSWLEVTARTVPNPNTQQIYDQLYPIFRDLHPALKDAFHRLSSLQAM